MKIGFLGVGNMGSAILRGYIKNADLRGEEFVIFNRTKSKAEKLKREIESERACAKIKIAGSTIELIKEAQIIFLGVKPKDFEEILEEIKPYYTKDKIVVSMAAGISIAYIKKFLTEDSKVVRIMPNTPAQIGRGATSISACDKITDSELDKISKIMKSLGVCVQVRENQIHNVIGASGSSPAYTYMYMDALIKEAVNQGMDKETAKNLVANAVIGAGYMLLEQNAEAKDLIEAVSSPNGTTVSALNTLRENNFEEVVRAGFKAAVLRSKEMER